MKDAHQEVLKMFGADSISISDSRGWLIKGIHKGSLFNFIMAAGNYCESYPGDQIYVGYQYSGSLTSYPDINVTEEDIASCEVGEAYQLSSELFLCTTALGSYKSLSPQLRKLENLHYINLHS